MPSFARLTLAAAAVLAPSFISVPAVEGALLPAPARHAARLTCEPTALPRAERARLKKLGNPEPTVLGNIAAALQRGDRASLHEDGAAIQSDAPAVPLDTGWRPAPLQPFSQLVGSSTPLPRLRSSLRRSPRGPPFL